MQFSTSRLQVWTDAEISDFTQPYPRDFVTRSLQGAYLAWIESARHGPVAKVADDAVADGVPFEVIPSGFISNLSATLSIKLLDDPKNPELITPKKYEDDGSLLWWFPPSDEPDPTKKQAKKEKNAEILDTGLTAKDPSRLFWMRLDLPNQFIEQDLREHELNPWRIYSSPFRNGSWFMQSIEQIYTLAGFSYQAFHTLEGNALYNDQFFARINPAFVPPFSYYEIVLCYLPEGFDRDTFIMSLAALMDYELTEGTELRRSREDVQTAVVAERDILMNGPRSTRAILRRKQTELSNLTPEAAEFESLQSECLNLQQRIEIEKDTQCYHLPSLLSIR